ncbi:MAG: hypothetical protein HY042_01000, partial [Spirochaetia bacterium]|nr:hypothetical protein [Spirochaetia bacterium]
MAIVHPGSEGDLTRSLAALRTGDRAHYLRFRPYYQPIVRMDTLDIWGYEVLGRRLIDGGLAETLGPVFHALDSGSPVDLAS